MKTLAIARASGRRLLRDKRALFFTIVLPIVLILVVGAVARGFDTFKVGIADLDRTQASHQLVFDLEHTAGISVASYRSVSALDKAVGRSEINAGVVIPRGLQASERSGRPVSVGIVAEQANTTQQAAVSRISSVISSYGGRVQAAQFASQFGGGFSGDFELAVSLAAKTPQVGLATQVVAVAQNTLPPGFEYSAPTELVLFVFLTAVTGASAVVESRRLGVYERVLAAPVRPSTIVIGESVSALLIAAVQSALIVLVGSAVFGVTWGNPPAALLLLALWCLVGAGAGMVAGTLFRTPEQASAIGSVVGITFAMLGGCMWPLSIVSRTMRIIGHATPQAWAVDAWTNLLSGHGTIITIWHQLGILALFAVGFFVIATARSRRLLGTKPHRPLLTAAGTRRLRPDVQRSG
jgi:ABC-2 type transport system permease protein